ncbi:hypothetical protein L2E82_00314 [Cichorium intybus]|uniref:Uncharacterized protein n=1 Tax=Cichorium intybus TaxID=13427 RepID=A0ACB9GXP9_CICIN|nr:hypothetical protein L2E82_00314 [Cichorium intybus]
MQGPQPLTLFIILVGGPGVGKGTQCARIAETYGFTHLSVGDLLRKEISSNTEYGEMILETITKGKIIGIEPEVVLFFDCDEVEMINRVLHRNLGRIDDNIDTTKQRLKVFEAYTLPVIKYYSHYIEAAFVMFLRSLNTVNHLEAQCNQLNSPVFLVYCLYSDRLSAYSELVNPLNNQQPHKQELPRVSGVHGLGHVFAFLIGLLSSLAGGISYCLIRAASKASDQPVGTIFAFGLLSSPVAAICVITSQQDPYGTKP